MYKRIISAAYTINIIFQAFFTLAMPIGLGLLLSWLLTSYASFPQWTYAILVVLGALTGFYSMIKFVLSAMAGLERLEKQRGASKDNSQVGVIPKKTCSDNDVDSV
ncbi:MAG: hypothetical protein J6Q85_00615 [Clostridia bacterium]|nr:hypothetical protein [Clostridia bacterium]